MLLSKDVYICVIVAEPRMSYFVAGLTNENPEITAPVYKQYNYVRYNDILPVSATGSVIFPPSDDMFRYVIIQQQFTGDPRAICMAEVKVFLRGTLLLFHHRENTLCVHYNDLTVRVNLWIINAMLVVTTACFGVRCCILSTISRTDILLPSYCQGIAK